MGKKRFVQLSVATSVAATCGAAAQANSMLEAAMTAKLPAVGQSVDFDKIQDELRLTSKEWRIASARLR